MSKQHTATGSQTDPLDELAATTDDVDAGTVRELAAQVELLREENQRLRTEYVQARQTEYRRAALGIGVLGSLAGGGGLVFPASQSVLFALAGIGLFTAVLLYYLTPERVVAASVGERTYAARASLGTALVSELGLQDPRVYVPLAEETGGTTRDVARLFVPQHIQYTLPDPDALTSVFVVPDDDRARGVSIPPTGAQLFHEFERSMTATIADTPTALVDQLTEALVEGFELADTAVVVQEPTDGRVTIGLQGSPFGDVDRFDHPLTSFVATGLAVGLQTPVRVETVTVADDDRFEYLVTVAWDDERPD